MTTELKINVGRGPMMQFRMARLTLLFVCSALMGCGGATSPREPQSIKDKLKDLVPLKGEVTVGGSPTTNLTISALNEKDLEEQMKWRNVGSQRSLATNGSVAPDGKFSFTTRDLNDGLPAGNYIILFSKYVENGVNDPSADSFNSQYNDPTTSTYKVTLEKGKPHDMGKIDLK